MARNVRFHTSEEHKKEFMKIFRELCYSRMPWEVWSDVITVMACSIANAVDKMPDRYEEREREYAECIKRLKGVEKPAQLFAIVVDAMELNSEQDFLGSLYMELELGSHWKGQFFTPYSICKMMSDITVSDVQNHIDEQGYLSVCDPACGAGATLIATANKMKDMKYNFQNHVLFVGQDIDRVTGMMCYIQLSLLGCAGYVCIANTLTNPLMGHVLFPEKKELQELWFTPMFSSNIWSMRRTLKMLKAIDGNITIEKTVDKEHFYMFFDFDKKEVNYGG